MALPIGKRRRAHEWHAPMLASLHMPASVHAPRSSCTCRSPRRADGPHALMPPPLPPFALHEQDRPSKPESPTYREAGRLSSVRVDEGKQGVSEREAERLAEKIVSVGCAGAAPCCSLPAAQRPMAPVLFP